MVLTAKPGDRAEWLNLCRLTRRTQDVRVFSPDQPGWRFNWLDYEYRHAGRGAGVTDNLADLFQQVQEVRDRRRGQADTPFWRDTQRQLLCAAIDVIAAAEGTVSLPLIYDVINSPPQSPEQVASDEWHKKSPCAQLLAKAAANRKLSARQEQDVSFAMKYFLRDLPSLAADTRSCVQTGLSSMANSFLRGHLRELFCTETTLTPEDCFDGRIIIVDLSVKEFNELGAFAQVLWKLCWQRAVERRDVSKKPSPGRSVRGRGAADRFPGGHHLPGHGAEPAPAPSTSGSRSARTTPPSGTTSRVKLSPTRSSAISTPRSSAPTTTRAARTPGRRT